MISFIVGNGVSRKEIDLDALIGAGPIYGCNALHRDFNYWNKLLAIDEGMIKEISDLSCTPGQEIVIPDEEDRWESAEYSPRRRRSNVGMNAMMEAIKDGGNVLYCLGFDFILNGDISVDNVYKDSSNYGKETHSTISDNLHRIRYLTWFASQNLDVQFVFVIPDGHTTKDLCDCPNIIGMSVSTFVKKLLNT